LNSTAKSPWTSAYPLLILTAFLWSANFVVGRGIQGQLPPLAMAFWRWAVALFVLLPFALVPMWRQRAIIAREWKVLVLLGVLGAGSFNTLVYIGLGSTTATNALLLNSSIPVLIAGIGWLFMAQKVSPRQAAGIFVSLCGIATIIFQGEAAQLLALRFNPGDIWVFAAIVVWAIYTLLLKHRPADLAPLPFLAATVLVGAAANLPFYLAELAGGAKALWSTASFAAITYFGIFPSVIAYLCWNRAVAEIGPTRSGVFIHLMPVFGTVLAILFLDESFHAFHAAGFALILAGIVVASAAERQALHRPAQP
jgi:drug/metabolite transporter (DMT)-like permease